ncbi:MAG: S-layer homology domain-containing protein [Clostridia bacterium]|nr:S-layer homology domain-containing protein [Clostridia bacterium]
MKRWIAIMCLVAMLITVPVMAASIFPDLPEGHWAYSAVEKMVNDGRVNGFPDGEFKPDNLVTRWQFAKMAGGDPDAMTEPDRDATRDEAALYLWERAGKPAGIAPGVITKESKNPDAVAWAYSTGIMQGDDGLHLRLDSTLTRAEAACLIVRAEVELHANIAFKDTVRPVILERIWNSMQTGIQWNPDGTVDNGKLAYIALTIFSGSEYPDFSALKEEPTFEGEFARELQLVCEECWGKENANATFMNQPAIMENMVAALSLYTMKQGLVGLNIDPNAVYEDATLKTGMGKLALSFASSNGIYLTAEKKLDSKRVATIKDISAVLLQLDEVVGLNRKYGTRGHSKLLKSEFIWPDNADEYALICEEVPADVYEVSISDQGKAVDGYQYARNFAETLENFLQNVSATFPKSVKVEWTFYPSLMVKNDREAIIRARLRVLENPDNLSLNEILKVNTFDKTYTGSLFYVDISTGENLGDVLIEADDYKAIRVVEGKE